MENWFLNFKRRDEVLIRQGEVHLQDGEPRLAVRLLPFLGRRAVELKGEQRGEGHREPVDVDDVIAVVRQAENTKKGKIVVFCRGVAWKVSTRLWMALKWLKKMVTNWLMHWPRLKKKAMEVVVSVLHHFVLIKSQSIPMNVCFISCFTRAPLGTYFSTKGGGGGAEQRGLPLSQCCPPCRTWIFLNKSESHLRVYKVQLRQNICLSAK